MTKARAYKGAGQEGSPGVTSYAPGNVGDCEGMNPHTPKWAPKYSENDYRDQNPLEWKFLYIIEKLLELRCLDWAHMTHLGK
jgi:hypothetical protein